MMPPEDYLQHELFVLVCELQAQELAREQLLEDALSAGFRSYADRLTGQIDALRAVRLDLQAVLAKREALVLATAKKERAIA